MKRIEDQIQRSVVLFLNVKKCLSCSHTRGSDVTGSNQRLNAIKGAKMKAMGYRKGFPDIMVYNRRGDFTGMALEIKAPGGVYNAEQLAVIFDLKAEGWFCPVFDAIPKSPAAIVNKYREWVEWYLNLKK